MSSNGDTDHRTKIPKIHIHSSGESGIFANAYLVETENGVVAIDSTLTVSESKSFRSQLDNLGKPLIAVILTHAHPDHVAGVTNLVQSSSTSIPVIALESVERLMRSTEELKRSIWGPIYKEEWISKWTYPNQLLKDKEEVTFDEITYRVHDFGAGGDSDANSIWILEKEPRIAFVGDLMFNGTHSYIADNHLQDWLKNLDKAHGLLSDISTIYPGHGKPGSMELIESQKKYLIAYSDAVKELSSGKPKLTDDTKKQLTRKMEEFLPNAGLSFLIAHSSDAVAAELASIK
ncbi:MAG: MBL fold metallo-hydrolase [Nitrososphaeraceae archaeon]|nr:MBL fold metallo-hydrolase [Nitrososphaeraceae archaeon]